MFNKTIRFCYILLLFGFSGSLMAQGEPITFSATGDIPYGSSEVPILQQQIADFNLRSPSEFFVHLGDIKRPTDPCDESVYSDVSGYLMELAVPVFVVPGDNETTDCQDPIEAWAYWMQYFIDFELNFCGAPFAEKQTVRPENFAFVSKGVLFIGINLVTGASDPIMEDDADWVEQQLADNVSQVRGAVIFSQCGPGSARSLFFNRFVLAAQAFTKPILFLHGDGHSWIEDNYWPEAPNVLRIQVDDGGSEEPVQITVTTDPQNMFTYLRNPSLTNPVYNVMPCVDAGPDKMIDLASVANLRGLATDDGVPTSPGTLTMTWTKISGPGTVTFNDPNEDTTSASFSLAGNYVLRLTADDGELQNFDELTVEVTDGLTPELTVGSPNGGETWQGGSFHKVTWNSLGTSDTVKIEYSVNNGLSWGDIFTSTSDDGTEWWRIPDSPTTEALVRISDTDGNGPTDMSDGVFTITPAPQLTVSSPNGGEIWQGGSIHNITWNSIATSGTVKIQYSADNGLNWSDIFASTSDDGIAPWTIPDTSTTQVLIRISDTDGEGPVDISDAVFIIIPPSAFVASFQDGVNGYSGTRDTKLEYLFPTTNYGGGTLLELDGSPDESVLLSWDLANIPVGSIVHSVDITVNVVNSSSATYEIYEMKRAWAEYEATWNQFAAGQNWEVAGADGPGDRGTTPFGWIDGSNSGSSTAQLNSAGVDMVQSWVNDPSSNQGFIIQDYVTASNSLDFNSREIAITADRPKIAIIYTPPLPTMTVTSPNGGEHWQEGNIHDLTWSSVGTSGTVKIEYSANSGLSWNVIFASTPDDGTQPWTVPEISTDQALLRISDTDGDGPTDISDFVFSIIPSPLSMSFQDGVNGYSGTRDAWIDVRNETTNHGGDATLKLDGKNKDKSILLYWDLTNIPLGSTIHSAEITVDVTHTSSDTYELYEINRAWIEDEVTWNTYASGQNWQVPGAIGSADRNPTVLGSITLSSNGPKIISLNSAGINRVQAWVNDPSSNHGFIVMDYDNNNNSADFSSRESAVPNRPKMTVSYTPGSPAVLVEAKIFLEGPYNVSAGEMTTYLNTSGFIPEISPYSGNPRMVTPIPPDITDWVLVQLRETPSGPAVASKSALLRNDGRIVADDGVTLIIEMAVGPNPYYIVIIHRNHLAVMSHDPVQLSIGSSMLYDFTIGAAQYYGIGGGKQVQTGIWGMWSGDVDQSKTVDANDRASSWNDRNQTGYYGSDCKLSGTVDANSRAITWNNRNKISTLP